MPPFCWQCGAPPTPAPATASPELRPLLGFDRLLTSNEVPLDSEIQSIRDFISDGQNQVETLNSQIDNLEAAIALLTQKRDRMAEHVRQHCAILSPVRRVPSELVCEILALSLSSDDEEPMNRPPWHLGHICRFWRCTVLAYPALWSSITIPSSSSGHSSFSMIETQLIRSADSPLTVGWSPLNESGLPDLHPADLVLAHSSRWRVLVLNLLHYEVELDWLRVAGGRLAVLETLQVRSIDPLVKIPDIFSPAPRLCKVLLADWDFDFSPLVLQIPWAQITHYSGSFAVDSQVKILEAAPNMVSCAIGFPDWVDSFEPDISVVLPCLRRLYIEMAGFLQCLRALLLQDLCCSYSESLDGRSEILAFVRRSSCSLQTLVLMRCSIDSDLITILGGLSSLTRLIIQDHIESDEDSESQQIALFDALATGLCPNLVFLAYGFGPYVAAVALLAMARSRFLLEPPSPRMIQLRLFRSSASFEACPRSIAVAIQIMRDDGFDIEFLAPAEANLLKGRDFFS